MADVAQIDVVARLHADRQVVEVLDVLDQRIGIEQHLVIAEISGAGRHHQVAVLQRLDHIQWRQFADLQLLGLEVNQDGAILAANDDGGDRAADSTEHVAHVDAGGVLDVGLIEMRVADREDA